MGRRSRGREAQRVKGFRPGREPAHLRKRAAKEQFGEMNAAQERMVELFADRTPEESRKLLGRWRTMTLALGVALSALAVLAWRWTPVAGVVVAVLAAGAFLVHLRLRAQREALEAMADAASGGRRGRR